MRKKGSNGDRLDRHDVDINKLQQEAKASQEKFEKHLDMHIKADLQETRFPGSTKPLYTYDEIANMHDVPKNRVQRVAENNNLQRRKCKNKQIG